MSLPLLLAGLLAAPIGAQTRWSGGDVIAAADAILKGRFVAITEDAELTRRLSPDAAQTLYRAKFEAAEVLKGDPATRALELVLPARFPVELPAQNAPLLLGVVDLRGRSGKGLEPLFVLAASAGALPESERGKPLRERLMAEMVLLTSEEDPDRAAKGLEYLSGWFGPEPIQVYRRLARAKHPFVRGLALAALLTHDGPKALGPLEKLLNSPAFSDPERYTPRESKVRADAVLAIGRLRLGPADRKLAKPILRLLAHKDPSITMAAVRAAVGLGLREAAPYLGKQLEHPNASMRHDAARDLCRVFEEGPDCFPFSEAPGDLELAERGRLMDEAVETWRKRLREKPL